MNLGFGDASALASHLADGLAHGEPLGRVRRLLDYETERQRSVIPMLAAIDSLEYLYGLSSSNPLVKLRTLGVNAVNSSTTMKGILATLAAG